MRPVLGIYVARGELRAVLGGGGRLLWAGAAPYASLDEVPPAIGRLAGELPQMAKRVRVVLARDLVQLRTVPSAPPLKPAAARRYVAFQATRLFRKNGAPLVTDGRVLRVRPRDRVLWAAATAEPLVRALVQGCEEAGLRLEALGPASEVLLWALRQPPTTGELGFPDGTVSERVAIAPCGVWRSRLLREDSQTAPEWAPPLAATGAHAPSLAGAYAATVRRPALDLLPPETKAARMRQAWRRLARAVVLGALLWVVAGLVHVARLAAIGGAAERELRAIRPALDSALALRRDLDRARAALGTMSDAGAHRSRTLMLLADLTHRLGDQTFLAAFQLSGDSTLRLVGYAPQAARVLAQMERAPWVRQIRFEGPVTREGGGAGKEELDRFSVVARIRSAR